MAPLRPDVLFAREWEWDSLVRFVEAPLDSCMLGLVYGRRRQGKTTLLQHLVTAYEGFYWQARDTEAADNLNELSAAYAAWAGLPNLRFATWDDAFKALTSQRPSPTPIVIDEVGRLIDKLPVLPSLIQSHLLPVGPAAKNNWTRLILCGSAFGQMRRLLDGRAPLRGRASLDLVVRPFDYRTAADFWGLSENPGAAFEHYSFVGGTPAYLGFASGERPKGGDVNGWVRRRLLAPGSALFREGRIVVTEDDALADQRLYWGLLGAIATGSRRWSDIERVLKVSATTLRAALTAVIDAGWVAQRHDPIRSQRSMYELLEPLVRFNRLIIEPNEHRLNAGLADRVWLDAKPMIATSVLAPQLEQLAWDWCLLYASADSLGGRASAVGPTSLPRALRGHDGQAIQHIDLAAVETTHRGGKRLMAIGEVKALTAPIGVGLLSRLDTAAESLVARPPEGLAVGDIRRILVSRSGFTGELERAVERRSDVELVDLHRLYHGE